MLDRRVINPWSWQDPLGFVQANEIDGNSRLLFCAGIVSVDPEGRLLHPGDLPRQVGQVLDNLETLLGQAGTSLADVVRMTYYTTDVSEFTRSNDALISRLRDAGCRPATSLIGVESLFHPDCVVEFEATAAYSSTL